MRRQWHTTPDKRDDNIAGRNVYELFNYKIAYEIRLQQALEDHSGQFRLRILRSLHRSLVEHSQREGISMNQYCVYLLSRNDAVISK